MSINIHHAYKSRVVSLLVIEFFLRGFYVTNRKDIRGQRVVSKSMIIGRIFARIYYRDCDDCNVRYILSIVYRTPTIINYILAEMCVSSFSNQIYHREKFSRSTQLHKFENKNSQMRVSSQHCVFMHLWARSVRLLFFFIWRDRSP